MCEPAPPRGTGWRGWIDLPEAAPVMPDGPWIDLSHPVAEGMPRVPMFPPPTIRRLMCQLADPINVTEFGMVVHTGTHLDAPFHFFSDGPTCEAIPPARLNGPGVVWRLDLPPDSLIEPAHLEAARPLLRPGDILALDTGSAALAGTPAYDHHPCLSLAAAEWLVARRVKLLACDFPTPDLPVHRRPASGFDWPVHRRLLSEGVLIVEHLRGARPLAGRRVEVMVGALAIAGSDGAPARIMARAIRDPA
jgi:kynurenine formamidase